MTASSSHDFVQKQRYTFTCAYDFDAKRRHDIKLNMQISLGRKRRVDRIGRKYLIFYQICVFSSHLSVPATRHAALKLYKCKSIYSGQPHRQIPGSNLMDFYVFHFHRFLNGAQISFAYWFSDTNYLNIRYSRRTNRFTIQFPLSASDTTREPNLIYNFNVIDCSLFMFIWII